jgi:ABC-type polysaccharide/polyol phosphate export permease
LTVVVLRNVDRAFMTLAHNLVVVAVGLILLGVLPTWRLILLLPALVLWWLNGMWLTLAVGIICARFRDIPPAILSIIQLVFLISPVLWRPEDVPEKLQVIVAYNPLSHFLTIVRSPLLGSDVPMQSWMVTLGIMLVGWAIALVLLRSYRTRVVYWV